MSDIVDTTEMYIKAIYELMEDGIVAMRARIVERLQHSGPTVSQTVARLERDGLLYVDVNRHLHLTDEGKALAVNTVRKHRYAERLLVDKLGFPWEKAHEEACKWEHVIGDEVLEYLEEYLGDAVTDPYGNPIPDTVLSSDVSKSLLEVVNQRPVDVCVVRIGEPLQVDIALLSKFREGKILPGENISVRLEGDAYILKNPVCEDSVFLDKTLGRHFFVK